MQDGKHCGHQAAGDDAVSEILDDRETERRHKYGRGPPIPEQNSELALSAMFHATTTSPPAMASDRFYRQMKAAAAIDAAPTANSMAGTL